MLWTHEREALIAAAQAQSQESNRLRHVAPESRGFLMPPFNSAAILDPKTTFIRRLGVFVGNRCREL